MAAKTSSQKHADLKDLSKKVKANIFDMLKLADEILADHEYVDQFGGEAALIEQLEAQEFSHFGGSPSLPLLLRAYRKNPRKAVWEEYQHNIWAMIDLSAPTAEGADVTRVNWKALAKELEAKLAQAEAALTEQREVSASLRRQCDEMLASNGELKGRISILEQYAPRKGAA